jgi:hypothetical protein
LRQEPPIQDRPVDEPSGGSGLDNAGRNGRLGGRIFFQNTRKAMIDSHQIRVAWDPLHRLGGFAGPTETEG